MKSFTRLFSESLRLPNDALCYVLSLEVAERASGRFVLETTDIDFDPVAYANAGHAALFVSDSTHPLIEAEWQGQLLGMKLVPRNAQFDLVWRGHCLQLVMVSYDDHCVTRSFIVADTQALAEAFFTEVCRWNDSVEDSILVYRAGHWQRDNALKASIANARFDNLILPDQLGERLRQDVLGFFNSKEQYNRFGIAWKRGVLLMGPPGNGKTHAIKAICKEANVPTLYVRSFAPSRGNTMHGSIHEVFRRARNSAPSLLVLEDLDSLVSEQSLSVFLNELDGFSANEGVLTIATTNHPQKLDPALLNRPSRFDRKITFPLPKLQERERFLYQMTSGWDEAMAMTPQEVKKLAAKTEGFSFAYLKELGVSSMMEWMAAPEPGRMFGVAKVVLTGLKTQITSTAKTDQSEEEED